MVKELHDMGERHSEYLEPMHGNKKHYPSIYISTKQLPCIKGCKVGERMSLLILAEVVSANKDGKYTLEIKKMGEEGDTKMTKAVEKAMGQHEELDEDNEDSAHEASESKEEEEEEHK